MLDRCMRYAPEESRGTKASLKLELLVDRLAILTDFYEGSEMARWAMRMVDNWGGLQPSHGVTDVGQNLEIGIFRVFSPSFFSDRSQWTTILLFFFLKNRTMFCTNTHYFTLCIWKVRV